MAYKKFVAQNLFYLSAALELAKMAASKRKRPKISDEQRIACVLGAVAASVAFLECSINGLYEHAASRIGRKTVYRRLLSSVYHDKLKFGNLPWLTKYQVALALAHKPTLELGAEPYQSADLLNQLRNALLHPKEIFTGVEEWARVPFGSALKKIDLEKKLSGRFTFNPPENEWEEFIPNRCLSVGCGSWAVQTAAKFYTEFESRMPPTAFIIQAGPHAAGILKTATKLKIK